MSASIKMEQIKALENGNGIQYLLDEASKIFGNPIFAGDRDYKLISYSKVFVTDDTLWNEIITNGRFSNNSLELFRDEGFFNAVANLKRITPLISSKLKYALLYGRLFNRDELTLGGAVMIMSNIPLEKDTEELFEAFCDILTEEFCQIEHYNNYSRAYLNDLIGKLIEGNIHGKEVYYMAQVDTLYENLKDYIYLAIVDAPKYAHEYTQLEHLKNLFKEAQPDFKYFIYSNYIIIIISLDRKEIDTKKDLKQINKLLDNEDTHFGISSSFQNLYDMQKYYIETVNVLTTGSRSETQKESNETRKSDLRYLKTEKILIDAMSTLLEKNRFRKITATDICEEALTSRACFYAHFIDKYDLLANWLTSYIRISKEDTYEKTEKAVNEFIHKNKSVITNLIVDADDETLEILLEFIVLSLDFGSENNEYVKSPKYTVICRFYAGGMLYYFQWLIKNRFPPDVMPMNKYLYDIIKMFSAYISEEE